MILQPLTLEILNFDNLKKYGTEKTPGTKTELGNQPKSNRWMTTDQTNIPTKFGVNPVNRVGVENFFVKNTFLTPVTPT